MIVVQGQAAESNIEERHSFSIKANAKAFKLLSSNLYSDKPLAIVRELGCNALDSHQAANKSDVPFKIVLPSDLHPWLEIIDYGTGLNDDQVKNVFTTYFESTKTTSNDYIGAMGLGSKSPFAYTDAFEVFARQNGVQLTYTCFLNKSGAPEIFLLDRSENDATNGVVFEDGVTIKVPIKQADYHLFHTACRKAYKFFDVKPIVGSNTSNWMWDMPEYGFEGTNFKVLKGVRQCFALMGPVAYPLDLSQFTNDGFLSEHIAHSLGGFVINFGIGKLDVNAGREGLSYDEDTIKNLTDGVSHIRSEMAVELQAKIDECGTLYDAMKFKAKNDASDLFKLTYKGDTIGTYITYDFNRLGVDKNPNGDYYESPWALKETSARYVEKLRDLTRLHNINITPSVGARFMFIDDRKKYQKKLRYADASMNIKHTQFIMCKDVSVTGKAAFAKLAAKFDVDGVPYSYISDMADNIPVIVREKSGGTTDPNAVKEKIIYSGFYKYKGARGNLAVSRHPNLNGLEMEVDCLYIKWDTISKRYNINKTIVHPDHISSPIWAIIEDIIKETGKPLVIATHKVYDKIPKNWVDISTLIPTKLVTAISHKAFRDSHPKWVITGLELDATEYADVLSIQDLNPVFKEFFDAVRGIKFGATYDYTTAQFIKNVYSITGENSPFEYVIKFNTEFFYNSLLTNAAGRYYSNWPKGDFKDSVIMFNRMIECGMIDENKLNDILKTK